MSELKLNKNGVPQLSANDIELKAEEVIKIFKADVVLQSPCQTPLAVFVERTAKDYDVIFDTSQDLGKNSQGYKVLGKFCFNPKAILIDKSVEGDLRQSFIIGHEFGHLVFHRKLNIPKDVYSGVDISDIEVDFNTGKKSLKTVRDWLEWQANRFSSAILMPRATLRIALVDVQRSLDMHRGLGRIYLDENPYSFRDFQQTLETLVSAKSG
jgi:hypothetical protein